jgi:hypothetical protein
MGNVHDHTHSVRSPMYSSFTLEYPPIQWICPIQSCLRLLNQSVFFSLYFLFLHPILCA